MHAYITLHYITLHYITLHYITLHYITLHYITLHYNTIHYITLHYITLHYITLHYITYLHTHTYIYIHIYIHIHMYMQMIPLFKIRGFDMSQVTFAINSIGFRQLIALRQGVGEMISAPQWTNDDVHDSKYCSPMCNNTCMYIYRYYIYICPATICFWFVILKQHNFRETKIKQNTRLLLLLNSELAAKTDPTSYILISHLSFLSSF